MNIFTSRKIIWCEVVLSLSAMGLAIVGCGNHNSGTRLASTTSKTPSTRVAVLVTPSTMPAAKATNVFYIFDDPQCTANERRAIRAATLAVFGHTPSAEALKELHYNVAPSGEGWYVSVWEYGPNHPPVPGGFTNVLLKPDYSVQGIMGGE